MVKTTNPNSTAGTSAHGGKADQPKLTRLPDYILTGSLNLHKSPVNAAALAKHISVQWDYLRINETGIISSRQLEINRNPEAHGGLRNGKPLTVSEWNKVQEAKLVEKRKLLAAQEQQGASDAVGASAQRGSNRTRTNSRGRGRGTRRRGRHAAHLRP